MMLLLQKHSAACSAGFLLKMEREGEAGEEEGEEEKLDEGLVCLGQTVGLCCAPLLALCCVLQVCVSRPTLSCGSKILDLCCCRKASEKDDETETTEE